MNLPRFLIPLLLTHLLIGGPLRAQEGGTTAKPAGNEPLVTLHPSTSPDGRWEYRLVPGAEGEDSATPVLVKPGTTEAVLKLSEQVMTSSLRNAYVIWSPDSRLLAFNFSAGPRDYSTVVYQRQGDGWARLTSFEDNDGINQLLSRTLHADARREHVPKGLMWRRIWDTWTVRRWVSANTAELSVASTKLVEIEETGEQKGFGAHFLLTLRFDARGHWTIVRTHKLTDKEIGEMHDD